MLRTIRRMEAPYARPPTPRSNSQEVALLTEWASRARIYKMSDTPEVSERHEAALGVLESMRISYMLDQESSVQPAGENGAASAHGSTPQGEGQLHAPSTSRRLSLGLFNAVQSDVHAIATGEIAHDGTIVVSQLAVHPSETHREESTSALRMMCGLRSLASTIEVRRAGCTPPLTLALGAGAMSTTPAVAHLPPPPLFRQTLTSSLSARSTKADTGSQELLCCPRPWQ